MPQWFLFVPIFAPFFLLLAATPVVIGCVRWLGGVRAFFLLSLLSAFAYLIETIALRTGFPYGTFHYNNALGTVLFDTIPWTVPLGWVPLIIASWTLVRRTPLHPRAHILGTTALLVLIDLILDPAAVSLGFWTYAHPGFWGGVPYTNFFGWVFSGFVGSLFLYLCTKHAPAPSREAHHWLLAGFLPAVGTIALWLAAR
jgi:putative membrane protein